jgi:hypothetical protein
MASAVSLCFLVGCRNRSQNNGIAVSFLILRATNLCKQGVTGSIPVTSTKLFAEIFAKVYIPG